MQEVHDTTMLYDRVGSVLVVVHCKDNPSATEWEKWVHRMGQRDYSNILVFSEGGGPNAQQRKSGEQFWVGKQYPKFAFVTTSPVVRGMLIAFAWLGMTKASAFSPVQFQVATQFLDVPPGESHALLETVTKFREQLAQVRAKLRNPSKTT